MNTPTKVINFPQFISDLKEAHKNKGKKLSLRPRNANRKQFYAEVQVRNWDGTARKHEYQSDLPAKFATHFAFYGNKSILNSVAKEYKDFGVDVFYK